MRIWSRSCFTTTRSSRMFHSTSTNTGKTRTPWDGPPAGICNSLMSCHKAFISRFSAEVWGLRTFRYWQTPSLISSLTWNGPGECLVSICKKIHAFILLLLKKKTYRDERCLLCQGGSGWGHLQAGGHLPSQLHGLSGQDQRGPGCGGSGGDGAPGEICSLSGSMQRNSRFPQNVGYKRDINLVFFYRWKYDCPDLLGNATLCSLHIEFEQMTDICTCLLISLKMSCRHLIFLQRWTAQQSS